MPSKRHYGPLHAWQLRRGYTVEMRTGLTVASSGCKVSGVVVGEGFRFGYKAAGDTAMLQELGASHGMQVSIVSLVSSGCAEGPATVRSNPTLVATSDPDWHCINLSFTHLDFHYSTNEPCDADGSCLAYCLRIDLRYTSFSAQSNSWDVGLEEISAGVPCDEWHFIFATFLPEGSCALLRYPPLLCGRL